MSFRPELGIKCLKEQLQQKYEVLPEEFYLLEARFEKNQYNERLFGDNDPSTRGETNRLTLDLNRFALEHLNISFNELCQSRPANIRSSFNGQRSMKNSSLPEAVSVPSNERLGIRKRWAVLVGVGEYDDERYGALPLCLHDVTAIAQVLYGSGSNGGFTHESICVLADDTRHKPTRENVLSALETMADNTEPDDLFLFYYTGHGDFAQDEAYLVARDGIFDDLKDTALSISRVKAIMQSARARAKVIILDACHSGANLNSKGPRRMQPKYQERVFHQAKGMAILASCDRDQLSYPWEKQKRSVYTYFLLEALRGKADEDRKGFVSVDDVHHYVTNGVASWVENKDRKYVQTPTRSLESSGDIIVCFYLPPPESFVQLGKLQLQSHEPVSSGFAASLSWGDVNTIKVQGEEYMLYKETVREVYTNDGTAIWRYAKAQHVGTRHMVWLKQVHIFHVTAEGENLRKTLKREHRLAHELHEYHGFPVLFLQEGCDSENILPDTTIAYDAWTGSTLEEVFHHSDRLPDRMTITSLLQSIISLCAVLQKLHRKKYSHRDLTPDNIILLNGETGRAVLQDIGLAVHDTNPGEEQVNVQAPEQRQNTLALDIPGPKTDIYQLGAIIYSLITNQPVSSHRPSSYNGEVPSALDDVIMRAVDCYPKNRWSDVMTFSRELKKSLHSSYRKG
jgi:hypothetical protein